MSNPTTLVEAFNSSLGDFTGTDPIRYDNGLWVEQGTTNLLVNPNAENATITNGIAVWGSGATLTKDTTEHYLGAASAKVVTDGAGAQEGIRFYSTTGVGTPTTAESYRGAVYLKGSGTVRVWTRVLYTDASVTDGTNTISALTSSWQRITAPVITSNASKTVDDLYLFIRTDSTAAITFYCDAAQIEKLAYVTSYADGSQGTGYAWTGTTDLSTSTRAASSAAISPAGILAPGSGAIAFRVTPTIETGLEEIWGECGVKGSGTDHVRWGRDASKHPFVEWSANNASYQRLTGSETLNALTAYDLYLGHSATTISLAVDAGTLQTGTRDAVSASWGAGNLTLEATKGGVVYNQFATFNRTLSTSEIKTLDRRISWSRSMFGNPFAYFQLRPY